MVKQDKDPDEKFEWDMTVVMMLVLAIVFLMIVAMAFWPLHHPSGREP